MASKLHPLPTARPKNAPALLTLQDPQSSSVPAAGITQTIIINNPSINVNYLQRGIDNWNLNRNLKEFSETRQLGFYNVRQRQKDMYGTITARNKTNSPYIIHKVKTQDIRSINKIYGGKQPQGNLTTRLEREKSSIIVQEREKSSTITYDNKGDKIKIRQNLQSQPKTSLQPIQKPISPLSDPSKITINLHKTKSNLDGIKPESPCLQQDPYATLFLGNETRMNELRKKVRRNRFERVISGEEETNQSSHQQKEDSEDEDEPQISKKGQNDKKVQSAKNPSLQLRRRTFNLAIDRINTTFLSNLDSYFTSFTSPTIPASRIELYLTNMNQPQKSHQISETQERSSSEMRWDGFEFGGEDEGKEKKIKKRRGY